MPLSGVQQVESNGALIALHRGVVTEWFINHPHALEQGFRLAQAPEGKAEWAFVSLRPSGNLIPTSHARGEVRFVDAAGKTRVYYRKLKVFDAKGRVLASRMHLQDGALRLSNRDEGAAYPVVIDPTVEPAPPKTYEDDVMERVNQERWNNGNLAPMKREIPMLDLASEWHCEDMGNGNFFTHNSLNDPSKSDILHWFSGETPWTRMNDVGYFWNGAAENVAAGYSSPSAVMSGWMNSSGHKANILSGNRELGIGYVYIGGSVWGHYWTQDFGTRSSVYPMVINREAYETFSTTVNLYLYKSGATTHFRFSQDGTSWDVPVAAATDMTYIISSENGLRTLYVRHYGSLADANNNVSFSEFTDKIVLNNFDEGFKITSISASPGGTVTIEWSDIGLNYTVQETTSLLSPAWSPAAGSWPVATNAWSGAASTSNNETFYRVIGQE